MRADSSTCSGDGCAIITRPSRIGASQAPASGQDVADAVAMTPRSPLLTEADALASDRSRQH